MIDLNLVTFFFRNPLKMVRKRPILHDARSAALIRDVSSDLVIKSSRLLHKARKPVRKVEGDGDIEDIKWQCRTVAIGSKSSSYGTKGVPL